MALTTVSLVVLWSLMNLSGLVVFAVYQDCDPFQAGSIKSQDQVR